MKRHKQEMKRHRQEMKRQKQKACKALGITEKDFSKQNREIQVELLKLYVETLQEESDVRDAIPLLSLDQGRLCFNANLLSFISCMEHPDCLQKIKIWKDMPNPISGWSKYKEQAAHLRDKLFAASAAPTAPVRPTTAPAASRPHSTNPAALRAPTSATEAPTASEISVKDNLAIEMSKPKM